MGECMPSISLCGGPMAVPLGRPCLISLCSWRGPGRGDLRFCLRRLHTRTLGQPRSQGPGGRQLTGWAAAVSPSPRPPFGHFCPLGGLFPPKLHAGLGSSRSRTVTQKPFPAGRSLRPQQAHTRAPGPLSGRSPPSTCPQSWAQPGHPVSPAAPPG